jgi:hypothetical protein
VWSAGRLPSTPEGIRTLAQSLLPSDGVALEEPLCLTLRVPSPPIASNGRATFFSRRCGQRSARARIVPRLPTVHGI